ncbi:MAG: HmuY family protein, partial [Longimicrobiales bacterium]
MGRFRTLRGGKAAIVAGIAGLAVACSDGDVVDPPTQDEQVLTVDADGRWAYVALGETANEVTVADPSASSDWDIAFNATRVMLNGGAAGPGDVRGYCLCQNADATDAQVQAMTPDGELADFEAVTAASIPTDDDAWETDVLDPAIDGWYSYNFQTHTVTADPTQVWRIRGAGDDPEYAKFHVTDIADATMAGGRVTIEFAVQPGAGEPMGAVESVVLDGRTAPVYFDFA